MKKEIIGLDIIRFLCAASVMANHLLPTISHAYDWALVGGVGVNIFFCISGFIIPQSSDGRSPFEFARSRIVRLAPGVWICATLTLLIVLAFRGLHAEPDIFRRYLNSIIFVPFGNGQVQREGSIWIDGPYWTLFVEISFYAVIFLLISANKIRWIGALASILGAVCTLYWVTLLTLHRFEPQLKLTQLLLGSESKRYLDLLLVHHGAWFGLGLNLWISRKIGWLKRLPSILLCLVGGLLQVSHVSLIDTPGPDATAFRIVYALVGLALIVASVVYNDAIHARFPNLAGTARWIGLTTYPLYLLHSRIGLVFMDAMTPVVQVDKIYVALFAMFNLVLGSFAVAYLLEPVLQRWLKARIDSLSPLLSGRVSPWLFQRAEVWRP